VNGAPITEAEYGAALLDRLPSERVREILDLECKTALMVVEGVALTDAEMEEELAASRKIWESVREMSSQEAYRSLSFEEFLKAQVNMDVDEVRRDRYHRGLFGLIRRFRAAVSEEEVRKEYDAKATSLYGESILVTDVQITFLQKNALVNPGGRRDHAEALKLGYEVLRKQGAGVPFDQIAREINDRRDRSFTAVRRRLRDTNDDRLLWDRAKDLKDGDVSSVFETLSEVHVLRRESKAPAPTFEKVRDTVREGLARNRAQAWIAAYLRDPARVQVRWPLRADR
jgi:hypothetical protein